MSFQGKIVISGTSKKPVAKFSSKAFDVASNVASATHIKIRGTDEFIEITDNLTIKKKKDSNGNPTDDIVHYTQINKHEEFVCEVNGTDRPISPEFYSQVVLMNKSEKGNHYRCDDNTFIHVAELQVPAYKKVAVYDDVKVSRPTHGNQFYVEQEVVYIKDKDNPRKLKKVVLDAQTSKNLIKLDDGTYRYKIGDEEFECYYKRGLHTRRYFQHLLLDGDKVVDVEKLQEKPNGDYVIKNVNGEDVNVGKKEIALARPFVEVSAMGTVNRVFNPHNYAQQRERLNSGLNLQLRWRTDNPSGIARVDINKSRTVVKFTYVDGSEEAYVQYGTAYHNDKVKQIFVDKINITDLGEGRGISFDVITYNSQIAQNVRFSPSTKNLTEFTINDRHITNIKWQEIGGYKFISSYSIDGVLVSDIKWENGKIKSCNIHTEDEFGVESEKTVYDIYSSNYGQYAITCNLTEKIENVTTKGDKISFKMGEYQFIDAELLGDNKIGKCKLRYKGREQEIENLSADKRFEQLSLITTISLDSSKVVPLVRSKLINHNGDKFELEADVVQTGEMKDIKYDINGNPIESTKNNGVASAIELNGDIAKAIEEQDKFKRSPYKTVVVDNEGKAHVLSDFNTKYDVADDFELDTSLIPNINGKSKTFIKKGKIEIDDKKFTNNAETLVTGGLFLCRNIFTLPLGIMAVAASPAIIAGMHIYRTSKQRRLRNYDAGKFKEKIQGNIAKTCENNINIILQRYLREDAACKEKYSQKEYEVMSENLRNKFRFDCQQEIAKLQVLGDGSIKCEFDPSQKIALTPTTHLAFLEHERLKQEMLNGKEDDYRLSGLLVTELEHLDGNDRIEREVELLEQYGGRFSQQRAYQIKVQNIELFLDKYNEGKAEDDKLSLSDFRKVMFNEYEKGVLEWGSLEDKLSVLQRSPEYLRENAKTRKEMLEKRREELMSQANKVKVETIKFEPKLDSKGRPVINDYSKSITAFMDIVEEAVATGTTSSIPKFSMGLYDSLSKDEKRLYDTAETISDATARKVDTTAMREVRFASKVSHNYVNDLRNEQQQISQRVEELSEESKVYRHVRDYERLYRVSLALQAEKDVFNENCQNLETKMDNVPFEELQVDTTTQIENELDLARAQYKAEEIKVDKAKKIFEKGYERQVDYWAYADFAKRYKREYERHVKFMKRSVGNIEISEQSLQASFYTEMCKDNPSRAESLKNEVETYKVKHHIEENVSAEVYAEVHSDEFARFIDERNAKSELGQLDPASEIAKCYFYAYSKRENPLKVQQFNRYFKKKCNERAKQRLMDKTLGVHGQEIFKHQVSSDQNLNNDANLEQYNDEEEVLLGA